MMHRVILIKAKTRPHETASVAHVLFVLLVFALIFATHSRWIFTHFSSDAYFLDSGWLAYLFESADPLLHNPSGVNDLSFYAHHLSPYIFLFGAPLSSLLGFTGIQIFAYHQGLFFGVFFLALYLIVAPSGMRRRDRILGTISAVFLGALSNALFQAAAYPHDEIAMISTASLAVAVWLGHHRRLFTLCLILLPLIREDGGFYAAVACLACLAVEYDRRGQVDASTRLLTLLALVGLFASASSFLIKAWFFPGFDAFAGNFSGHWWNHVTGTFVLERVKSMLLNLNIVPVLVGCALLAAFDIRYLTGLVLVSPVYLLHLLAIRPEHGHFTLYFALPWLLPCAIWLAVFARRSRMSNAAFTEAVVILAAALALSAPIQAAVGARGQFWYVAMGAFQRPVTDIRGMQDFALWVRKSAATEDGGPPNQKKCLSQGMAALIPNDIRPDEVLATDADLRMCQHLILMRGEIQYAVLSARGQAVGFERVAARHNAELWVVPEGR